jgi:hypothetical protein
MKFTLIFTSTESTDLSVGLVFAPCPMWVIGEKILLNPHPSDPSYQNGDFKQLLGYLRDKSLIPPENHKVDDKIFIIVHHLGHGTSSDLYNLVSEIKELGLEAKIYNEQTN